MGFGGGVPAVLGSQVLERMLWQKEPVDLNISYGTWRSGSGPNLLDADAASKT